MHFHTDTHMHISQLCSGAEMGRMVCVRARMFLNTVISPIPHPKEKKEKRRRMPSVISIHQLILTWLTWVNMPITDRQEITCVHFQAQQNWTGVRVYRDVCLWIHTIYIMSVHINVCYLHVWFRHCRYDAYLPQASCALLLIDVNEIPNHASLNEIALSLHPDLQ